MDEISYCPRCGTRLAGPRKFCLKCNSFYADSKEVLSQAPIIVVEQSYASKLDAQKEKKVIETKKSIVGALIFLVLGIAIICAIILSFPQETTCNHCGGTGRVRSELSTPYERYLYETNCPLCGGDGTVVVYPWRHYWIYGIIGFVALETFLVFYWISDRK